MTAAPPVDGHVGIRCDEVRTVLDPARWNRRFAPVRHPGGPRCGPGSEIFFAHRRVAHRGNRRAVSAPPSRVDRMEAAEVIAALDSGSIAVRRSARRRKTISVSRQHGAYLVAVPARYDVRRHAADIGALIARLERRAAAVPRGDADLEVLAAELNDRYFDDGVAPSSVRWVANQRRRFASATSATRSIRVSDRLREVPRWVLESVLVHELAHLRVPDHSAAFDALTRRHPDTDRAEIFLSGFSYGEAAAEGVGEPGN